MQVSQSPPIGYLFYDNYKFVFNVLPSVSVKKCSTSNKLVTKINNCVNPK